MPTHMHGAGNLLPGLPRLAIVLTLATLAAAVTLMPAAQAAPDCADLDQQARTNTGCVETLYQVLLPGFDSRTDAERNRRQLRQNNIDARVIMRHGGYALLTEDLLDDFGLLTRIRELESLGYVNIWAFAADPMAAGISGLDQVMRGPPGDVEAGAQSFTFGQGSSSAPDQQTASATQPGTVFAQLHRGMLEGGALTRTDAPADSSNHLTLGARVRWLPASNWEFQAGARVDGLYQTGDRDTDELSADYDDTFIRFVGDRTRFTIGAQTVIWGRMDGVSPTDRLSTVDLRRFALDDLPDRRRASPAIRFEAFPGNLHVDALFLPMFRAAELPDRDSIWHPVDRERGQLVGQRTDPAAGVLIREGSFDEDDSGMGGGGIRVTRDGRALDLGMTIQRARHSTPYYSLNRNVRNSLLQTQDPVAALTAGNGATFTAEHPWTWVAGLEAGLALGATALRGEVAWLSHVPVTTDTLEFDTRRGVDWALGADIFPGDGDLRITMELLGTHLLDADDVLDRRNIYQVSGEIAQPLRRETWWLRLRGSAGLDERDIYVNPEIAYSGFGAQEFYVGFHYFDGTEETAGGFFKERNIAVAGWRGQF